MPATTGAQLDAGMLRMPTNQILVLLGYVSAALVLSLLYRRFVPVTDSPAWSGLGCLERAGLRHTGWRVHQLSIFSRVLRSLRPAVPDARLWPRLAYRRAGAWRDGCGPCVWEVEVGRIGRPHASVGGREARQLLDPVLDDGDLILDLARLLREDEARSVRRDVGVVTERSDLEQLLRRAREKLGVVGVSDSCVVVLVRS